MIGKADLVVDCTPGGVGKKISLYMRKPE